MPNTPCDPSREFVARSVDLVALATLFPLLICCVLLVALRYADLVKHASLIHGTIHFGDF